MTVPTQKVLPTLLENKEQEALEYIRQHEPPEGYALAYSGGKDSEVLLHLTQRSGVKFKPHYCNTTIDPPEILKHIRRHHPEVKILRGKQSFWQWMLYAPRGKPKGLPLRVCRWCCDVLKKDPAKKTGKHRLIGTRAQESDARARYPQTANDGNLKIYKPLFHWSTEDIWGYIHKYDLPYLRLYDLRGCARVGCVICPLQSHKNRLLMQVEYPRLWALFRQYCDKLFALRPDFYVERNLKSGQDIYDWWCSGLSEEKWRNRKAAKDGK